MNDDLWPAESTDHRRLYIDSARILSFIGFIVGIPVLFFAGYSIFLMIDKLFATADSESEDSEDDEEAGDAFQTHDDKDEFEKMAERQAYINDNLKIKKVIQRREQLRQQKKQGSISSRSSLGSRSSSRMFSLMDRSGESDSLPSREKSAWLRATWKNRCCPICLSEFKIGEEICWPSNKTCVHAFHKDCMTGWLMKNDECPCCRKGYLDGQEKTEIATVSTVDVRNSQSGSSAWEDSSTITLGSNDFDPEDQGSFNAEEFCDDERVLRMDLDSLPLLSGITNSDSVALNSADSDSIDSDSAVTNGEDTRESINSSTRGSANSSTRSSLNSFPRASSSKASSSRASSSRASSSRASSSRLFSSRMSYSRIPSSRTSSRSSNVGSTITSISTNNVPLPTQQNSRRSQTKNRTRR